MFSIRSFPTEKVSLHKLNGQVVNDIKALVDENEIHIDDTSVVIEDGDYIVRALPNGSSDYYQVTDRGFFKGDNMAFPDHYQSKVAKVGQSEMEKAIANNVADESHAKPHKLFISHSSKDKEYVLAFAELLEDIGMPDGTIVCSSVPGHGIPGGAKTFEWLRDQFLTCDLRVVLALSENYYASAVSLNEMGAAWISRATGTLILLPGFDFKDIRGCVDPTEIGIKLDSDKDELKHRLGELKDTLIAEYSLPSFSGTRWERRRDSFIQKVQEISQKVSECDPSDRVEAAQNRNSSAKNHATPYGKVPDSIPVDPAFLLVYAAESDGRILMVNSISSGITISAGGKQFMKNDSPREQARWKEALAYLLQVGWAIGVGHKGNVFEVTGTGYNMADMLKNGMQINTDNEPIDELKEFGL